VIDFKIPEIICNGNKQTGNWWNSQNRFFFPNRKYNNNYDPKYVIVESWNHCVCRCELKTCGDATALAMDFIHGKKKKKNPPMSLLYKCSNEVFFKSMNMQNDAGALTSSKLLGTCWMYVLQYSVLASNQILSVTLLFMPENSQATSFQALSILNLKFFTTSDGLKSWYIDFNINCLLSEA